MKIKDKVDDECQLSMVLLAYWIIVILGKIIRYTVLKKTLVDMSLGNGWIGSLTSGFNHFVLNMGGDSVASENSKALFQIFRYVGFSTYRDYELVITLIWNVIFFGILLTLKNKISVFQMIFLVMSIAVLNIWDFCLAKEPLQMIYFVAIYFVYISKSINEKLKYPLAILIILFSCISFRSYYILIVAFSVLSYFIINKLIIKKDKVTFGDFAKILLLYGIVYMIVIVVAKNFNSEAYDAFMYFNKRETLAKTDLSGLFHSEILPIMAIDYIILVLRMLFPIELIRFGPQYWLYAIYQIMISIIFIKAIINIKTSSKIEKNALYIFIGFLFASATFEPDFGSWVRHEAVVLPLIILMANLFNNKTIKNAERKEITNEQQT